MCLWDLDSFEVTYPFLGYNCGHGYGSGTVQDLKISAKGNVIVTASNFDRNGKEGECVVKVWHYPTCELLATLPHDSPVTCVAITPDNKTVISGDRVGNLLFWDVGDLKPTAKAEQPKK